MIPIKSVVISLEVQGMSTLEPWSVSEMTADIKPRCHPLSAFQ